MLCLSFVNTGHLASINPVLRDPSYLVINRVQLNVHFSIGVTNEAYLSAVTATNISQSFTCKMAAKID